jgi:hypothetical protein
VSRRLEANTHFADESVCLMDDNVWNYFVRYLTALCFMASSAVHALEFMICQQWVAVISSISRFFSITTNEQYVASWYFCMTPA